MKILIIGTILSKELCQNKFYCLLVIIVKEVLLVTLLQPFANLETKRIFLSQ